MKAAHPYATCPYRDISRAAQWRYAMSQIPNADIDPHIGAPYKITAQTKIATAGSCFAQNISRRLAKSGYSYLIAEPGPAWTTEDERQRFQYGVFSARYGNIYTSLQLRQLQLRALDRFHPDEPAWQTAEGRWIDPLRPNVQPGGFYSREELNEDRASHLHAVRRMFAELDIFIFTLGLTETWISKKDGTAFPVCPGCGFGEFDAQRYEFVNLGVDDVVQQMQDFADDLLAINASARIILTVSPVPLAATMEQRHVLQSSTYSKAVLRVAAEALVRARPEVFSYFGSYEIITSTLSAHTYFEDDKRSVTSIGVEHAMRSFFLNYADGIAGAELQATESAGTPQQASSQAPLRPQEISQPSIEAICDEDIVMAALAGLDSRS